MQRPLNTSFNLARDGAAKRLTDPATVPGQRRQTSDAVFTGPGQSSLDDTPNLPLKSHTKPVAVHPGMTEAQRATVHPIANDPKVILSEAANLGQKA